MFSIVNNPYNTFLSDFLAEKQQKFIKQENYVDKKLWVKSFYKSQSRRPIPKTPLIKISFQALSTLVRDWLPSYSNINSFAFSRSATRKTNTFHIM